MIFDRQEKCKQYQSPAHRWNTLKLKNFGIYPKLWGCPRKNNVRIFVFLASFYLWLIRWEVSCRLVVSMEIDPSKKLKHMSTYFHFTKKESTGSLRFSEAIHIFTTSPPFNFCFINHTHCPTQLFASIKIVFARPSLFVWLPTMGPSHPCRG